MDVMRWFERRRPSLHDRPWVPIADATEGEHVRVIGRVVSRGESIVAPLSGRDCVLWSLAIDELWTMRHLHELASKHGHHGATRRNAWVQRLADQDAVSFIVEDATGRAAIEVRSLVGWLDRDHVRRTWGAMTATALTRVLERYDAPDAPLRQKSGKFRAYEGVLRVGDEIAVQGYARWIDVEPSPDARGYRAPGLVRRLVLDPREDDPVTATNDPSGVY